MRDDEVGSDGGGGGGGGVAGLSGPAVIEAAALLAALPQPPAAVAAGVADHLKCAAADPNEPCCTAAAAGEAKATDAASPAMGGGGPGGSGGAAAASASTGAWLTGRGRPPDPAAATLHKRSLSVHSSLKDAQDVLCCHDVAASQRWAHKQQSIAKHRHSSGRGAALLEEALLLARRAPLLLAGARVARALELGALHLPQPLRVMVVIGAQVLVHLRRGLILLVTHLHDTA
jgi:hypothetical protein